MAFFYVKSGGTCAPTSGNGRETTARTGPWTATTGNYYPDLIDAIATGKPNDMTVGDVIVLSDAHAETVAASANVNIPAGVELIVTDDLNQEQYKKPTTTLIDAGIYNWDLMCQQGAVPAIIRGLSVDYSAWLYQGVTGAKVIWVDCDFNISATNEIQWTASENEQTFINCSFTGRWRHRITRASFSFIGCNYPSTHPVDPQYTNSGTLTAVFDGCDFSAMSGASLYTFNNSSTSVTAVFFNNCRMPGSWAFSNIAANAGHVGLVEGSSSAYEYYQETSSGEIDFVTDVFYTSHDTLDDGITSGSFELVSNSATAKHNFLTFIGATGQRPKVLSAINTEAATKTKIRVRMVVESGDSIDEGDINFLFGYPISGEEHHTQWVEQYTARMETGAALSTETGNWTNLRSGLTLGTQYYIDLDMGAPGNGRCRVIPQLTKPNVTLFISWQLEFVA